MKKEYYFGFDLDNIKLVQEYVKNNYSSTDYKMHIGYGDDVMNCLEIDVRENDKELLELIEGCEKEDEDFEEED
jgi:hypothetical protein